MSLIEQLSSSFGLNPQQAEGAVGAIGRAAQGKLAPDMFAELGKLVPGLDRMVAGAPKPGGMLGMLGGGLGEAAAVASAFSALGIDLAKIKPIAAMVLGFVNQHGSDGLKRAIAPFAQKLA